MAQRFDAPRTFKVLDKDGKPHYFDRREDCERFLISIGHSRTDAEYYSALLPPETRTDDADRMKRVARLDESRLDSRQKMIERDTKLKPLGQQFFPKDK